MFFSHNLLEEIVNLFAEFFQDLYVNEGEPVLLPTIDLARSIRSTRYLLPSSRRRQQLRKPFWGWMNRRVRDLMAFCHSYWGNWSRLSRIRWRICSICSYQLEFSLMFRKNLFSFQFSRIARSGISLAIWLFRRWFAMKLHQSSDHRFLSCSMVSWRAVPLSPTW
jgi:hypothetical protein